MTTTDSKIVENLQHMISQIEQERDQEIETVRTRYRSRIDAIKRTIAVMCGGKVPLPEADQAPAVTSLSVGEDKIEWVRAYLLEHRSARQADIATAMAEHYGISSGSASGATSVALRRLYLEGYASRGAKDQGSQRWELVKVAAFSTN